MSQWLAGLSQWLGANPEWLGLAILLLAFGECLAIVGLLIPGTVLLFAAAVLAGSGVLSLGSTLLLAWVGAVLGDLLSYATGRYFHQDIRRLPGLRHHPQWLAGADVYFQRYGIASLLIGRFIGPLRPMLPMVAGMFDMPAGRFIAVSLLASIGWALAYMLPGWATGAALRLPLPEHFWQQLGLLAAGIAGAAGISAYSSLRGRRHASLLASLGTGLLLLAMMLTWPLFDDFDRGLLTLLQNQRNSAMDSLMLGLTLLGEAHVQLFAVAALLLILLIGKQWRAVAFAGTTLLSAGLCNVALKQLFARSRPDILLEPLSSFSFPSGHSTASFALLLVLAVLAGRGQPPRLRLTWVALASLTALGIASSRVYLGVHWPSDIIAGALLAATLCAASLSLWQWRQPLPAIPARLWWWLLPACLLAPALLAAWQWPDNLLAYRY
jgi:membrane protein DedA with SNARE-associated domain